MALRTDVFDLTNDLTVLASVPSGQSWRVNFLSVANTGDTFQGCYLQIYDDSAREGLVGAEMPERVILPESPILGRSMIQPLEGELILNSEDRLEARGPLEGDVNLTITIVIDDGT